jgi:pimeloyl-ACP methyl ester carboxylesterase
VSTPRSLRWSEHLRPTAFDLEPWALSVAALHHPAHGTVRGTVVLVHGFSGSKEDFADLLPHLGEQGWDAIAIDLPGQHESDPHPDPSADALAAALAATLRAVAEGADHPDVHLVGHSLGGVVARRTVLQDPTAVTSLTLMCSGPAALTAPDHRDPLERFAAAMSLGMVDAVWEHMQHAQRESRPGVDDDVLTFLERRLRAGDATTHVAMAQMLLHEPDLTDALATAALPVHVVHGVDDDVWTPAEQVAMAARLCAAVTAIDGAGHSPAVDDPAATAAALDAWWRSSIPAGHR